MMNALKLLAVDRSLDSKKPVFGRFRVSETSRLPVFNRVVEADTKSAPVVQSAPPVREARSMWRRFFGWVRPDTEVWRETTGQERRSEDDDSVDERVTSASVPVAVSGSETPRRLGWFHRTNPFKGAVAEPVQSEFRFENVRAICNDLNDTDFVIKS